MPGKSIRCSTVLAAFVLLSEAGVNSLTYVNDTLTRPSRDAGTPYLIFPQGSNVQLVYCLTIGTYAKPPGLFTMGVTAGLAWELPHRNTVPYRKPAEVYHRRSRRELYRKLELMLRTQGKDGKECVRKAICKAAERNRRERVAKGTFLEEILHSLFTLAGGSYDVDPMTEYERAYWENERCDEARARCPDVF